MRQAPAALELTNADDFQNRRRELPSFRQSGEGYAAAEYMTTVRKWKEWGGGVPIEKLGRTEIREFLDWVYERPSTNTGITPDERPTRHASIYEPLSLGRGISNSSIRRRGFRSPNSSAMSQAGII